VDRFENTRISKMSSSSRTRKRPNLTLIPQKSRRGKRLAHLRRFKYGGCGLCGPCAKLCGLCATCCHLADPPSPQFSDDSVSLSSLDTPTDRSNTPITISSDTDDDGPNTHLMPPTVERSIASSTPTQSATTTSHEGCTSRDVVVDTVDAQPEYDAVGSGDDNDHGDSHAASAVYQASLARYSGDWWAPRSESTASSEYEILSLSDDEKAKQKTTRTTASQTEAESNSK
jgi:hypothetical protein